MPEGDTIHRTARALHAALAGRQVIRFESVFPRLTRVDHDRPLAGRTIESVEARGKHVLIHFTGGLSLRTHMRMHGSWHIYRPGERWQRPSHEFRIRIATDAFEAIGFQVPVAEFLEGDALARQPDLQALGPDPFSPGFDAADAVERLAARGAMEIADALLDQRALAGVGNVFKSEVLFVTGTDPFAPVSRLDRARLARLVDTAARQLRLNVEPDLPTVSGARVGPRRTTGSLDPRAPLWVYGRLGEPCRRCGTPIARRQQGPHARLTYWCPTCQPPVPSDPAAADG